MSYGNNPIEKNVNAVDITEAFTRAVGRTKMEKLKKIVRWLESCGYKNPVLYGGALRDLYIGKLSPKDYDFEVNACDIATPLLDFVTLDIHHRGNCRSRQNEHPGLRALRADAPINAVSLGTNGRIYAHPDFLEHTDDKVYAIREDLNSIRYNASLKRFDRILKKYPDMILSQDCTVT
jgi:hypothetical protein